MRSYLLMLDYLSRVSSRVVFYERVSLYFLKLSSYFLMNLFYSMSMG